MNTCSAKCTCIIISSLVLIFWINFWSNFWSNFWPNFWPNFWFNFWLNFWLNFWTNLGFIKFYHGSIKPLFHG